MLDARRGGARRDDGHLRGGNVGQEGTHQLPEEVDHTEGAGGVPLGLGLRLGLGLGLGLELGSGLGYQVDDTEGAGGVHARAAAAVVEGHRDGGLLDVRPTLEQLAEADVHLGLGFGAGAGLGL